MAGSGRSRPPPLPTDETDSPLFLLGESPAVVGDAPGSRMAGRGRGPAIVAALRLELGVCSERFVLDETTRTLL